MANLLYPIHEPLSEWLEMNVYYGSLWPSHLFNNSTLRCDWTVSGVRKECEIKFPGLHATPKQRRHYMFYAFAGHRAERGESPIPWFMDE
jgi:hypothetical protein